MSTVAELRGERLIPIKKVVEAMDYLGIPNWDMENKLLDMRISPLSSIDLKKVYQVLRFIYGPELQPGDWVGFDASVQNPNAIFAGIEPDDSYED